MATDVLPPQELPMKGKTVTLDDAIDDDECKRKRHILVTTKKKPGIFELLFSYVFAIPIRFLMLFGIVENKPVMSLTGNHLVDKSPARPLLVPPKRKHWEVSEEEEASTLAMLQEDYNSEDDDDYNPEEEVDTDTPDEEYDEGDTEDEETLKCIDDANILSKDKISRRPEHVDVDGDKLSKGIPKPTDITPTPNPNGNAPIGEVTGVHVIDDDVEEIGQDVLVVEVDDVIRNS